MLMRFLAHFCGEKRLNYARSIMPEPDQSPQESNEYSLQAKKYLEELEALRAVVAAEIAENAKQADIHRLTEADWEAIRF
jgi:hypothetical protein